MFPELQTRNASSFATTSKRRKDIKSPKTERDYKKNILSNQLSPNQRFKPIDFKENLIISMSCSEAMRIKDYQKLCQIVTKFEHKTIRENLAKAKHNKEFGHYAQKKGYNILQKYEVLENQHLIEQLKRRTSLGIVRWGEGEKKIK